MPRAARWGSIRKLPSGRFQARYPHPELPGVHIPLGTFAAKIDAEAALAKEQRAIERGDWIHPDDRAKQSQRDGTTVGELFTYKLEHDELTPGTVKHYRTQWTNSLAPTFEHLPAARVTRGDIETWWLDLRRAHPDRQRGNNQALTLLKNLFAQAVEREIIDVSPVRVTPVKVRPKRARTALTEDQLQALCKHLPAHYVLPIITAAATGMRVGEWCELRGRDLKQRDGRWWLEITRHYTREGGVQPGTKTKDDRTIPVPESLTEEIQEAARRAGRDGLLFVNEHGGRMQYNKINPVLARAAAAAGIDEKVTTHDLRHTCATLMARQGVEAISIMMMLGHKSADVALGYQHSSQQRLAEVVDLADLRRA